MRRAALVLLLAVPLVAAACGGSKSTAPEVKLSPVAYVKQAATKTAGAPSHHFTLKMAMTVSGSKIDITGDGDAKGSLVTAHVDFAAPGFSGGIDEVMDGTDLYMKSPLFSSALPKGKTWMKLDLQKLGKSQGIDFSALLGQNPSDAVAQLQAIGSVTEVGAETVDGVETTHYRGKIDPAKLPQSVPNATYRPYDVWIANDDGYVRRMHMSFSLADKAAGRVESDMTVSFTDFGKDVSIDVPAAADVADVTNESIPGLGG
jgi:hypothetical protein